STGIVHDLLSASHRCRDDGNTSVERLDKRYAEGFRTSVRLAVNIRGRKDSRDIRTLSQKHNPVGNAQSDGCLLQTVQVTQFAGPLRSSHDPGYPIGQIPQQG